MIPKEVENRILRSADSLVRSVRKEILAFIRQGKTLDEIYEFLKRFQLPSLEVTKLRSALEKSMEEIARARGVSAYAGAAELIDVDSLIASSRINFPRLRKEIRTTLLNETRRAIASGAGVEHLAKQLREKELNNVQTLAETAVAGFNNELTFAQADDGDKYLYSGPVTDITRPFCRAHAGKIYTLEQIENMDNGQGLPVRSNLGGYRCRHSWEIYIK
jgi:hypothetical protein